MGLSEKGGLIARRRHAAGKSFFPDLWVQIDTVVMNAVGSAKLPCQDRRTRRLAHNCGRNAI